MRFELLRMSFVRLITLVIAILAGTTSCRSHLSFQHYSTLFEVPLHGTAKRVPDSRMQIAVLSIEHEQNRALFRVEHLDTGQSMEEWVASGDYFQSSFGTHGLRVNSLERGIVRLQRFGVR